MEFLKCVGYIAFLGIVSHFVGEALPRKWFHPDGFLFRCRKWEKGGKVYNRLKIRAWKDKLPDASRVAKDMYPKKVDSTPNTDNLRHLIEETCVAEFIHLSLIVCSLALLVICRGVMRWIGIGACLIGNVPFILIQRFNRPRLQLAMDRLEKREKKA